MSTFVGPFKTLVWRGEYAEHVSVVVLGADGEPAFGLLREGGLCRRWFMSTIARGFASADLWTSLEPSHVGPEGDPP